MLTRWISHTQNSGIDLFNLKLGTKNDRILANNENLWLGKAEDLVIVDLSFVPSTSKSPESTLP